MVKVGVISDWARSRRGNAWQQLLAELDPAPEFTPYPIADLIVSQVDEAKGLQQISKEQVLIINWDAANGDPEFGGHLCQKWLEHRRPEIIEWVRKGGILLIESQTTLGVPCAAAYDALAGNGELPTSGIADPTKPLQSLPNRSGMAGRKTARFPDGPGFRAVDNIAARNPYPDILLFPKTTTGFLADALENVASSPVLWRGVFRKTLPFTRNFPWISIIETDARWLFRHSIMKVAKVGDGAIFASTMMLASTGQRDLVSGIVRCATGNTQHLPTPVAAVERVDRFIKWFIMIFGGILAGLILGHSGPVLGRLKAGFSALGVPAEALKGWIELLLLGLGIAGVLIGRRLYLNLQRLFRNIIGY